jgi:hypothetical protein
VPGYVTPAVRQVRLRAGQKLAVQQAVPRLFAGFKQVRDSGGRQPLYSVLSALLETLHKLG